MRFVEEGRGEGTIGRSHKSGKVARVRKPRQLLYVTVISETNLLSSLVDAPLSRDNHRKNY